MRARKRMERSDEPLAFPISELYHDVRIPWGRDKIVEHADEGLLPTFNVGRRRFVAADDLERYIENLKDTARTEP